MPYVIEGILTTRNPDGAINIAPQGPILLLDGKLLLRPFVSSNSAANLLRERAGVFHLTDDVLLLAQTAVGEPEPVPQLLPAETVAGDYLATACSVWEFRISEVRVENPRLEFLAELTKRREIRPFSGWNRAQFAVLETAIMATRLDLLPCEEVAADMARWQKVLEKTGGPREIAAFEYLQKYIQYHQDLTRRKQQ